MKKTGDLEGLFVLRQKKLKGRLIGHPFSFVLFPLAVLVIQAIH